MLVPVQPCQRCRCHGQAATIKRTPQRFDTSTPEPLVLHTPEGRTWLRIAYCVNRWGVRFIVAACPWHRHLWQGWTGTNIVGWGRSKIKLKDEALRHDGSVDMFIWPATKLGGGALHQTTLAGELFARNGRARGRKSVLSGGKCEKDIVDSGQIADDRCPF